MLSTKLSISKCTNTPRDKIILKILDYVKHKHHNVSLAEFIDFDCDLVKVREILEDDLLLDYYLFKDVNIIRNTLQKTFCFTYNFLNFKNDKDLYINIISDEVINRLERTNEIVVAKIVNSNFNKNLYTFSKVLSDIMYNYEFNICDIVYLARLLLANEQSDWNKIIKNAINSSIIIQEKLGIGEMILLPEIASDFYIINYNNELKPRGEIEYEDLQDRQTISIA